jgi:anti-sigma factor RsiW
MVDAYVDGELSAGESAAFEQALKTCPECRKRLESARAMSGLLQELPLERAPDLLRARIDRELRAIAGRPRQRMRWSMMAASLFLALSLGWLGGHLTGRNSGEEGELLATYLRVASSDRPVEVASTDRHTVKPWFAGRIDYSPPVHDLTSAGYPLEGGRLDVVQGRKVSVLVYRHNQHRLALSLWPSDGGGDSKPNVTQRDGFALADWRHGGFELHAVSDLAPAEMSAFAAALDRAMDTDR